MSTYFKAIFYSCLMVAGCASPSLNKYTITPEYTPQEYIWLSWNENGFLGGDPFYTTILHAIKEIHQHVKVTIFYGPQLDYDSVGLRLRITEKLLKHNIDTNRVNFFYNEIPFGAIQDPGPVFLQDKKGNLAIADFSYRHPDPRAARIDQNVGKKMSLPVFSSRMITEGGAWQTDGKGTILLVESVELDRNKGKTRVQIENEYKKMLGVTKFIWLPNGLKEEEWGKLENGVYGIGTGGHIDEFCRFINDSTVLLTSVDAVDTFNNFILKESFIRMENNFKILTKSITASGNPLNVIRVPAGPLISKKVSYDKLSQIEKSWFDDIQTDSVEFYLPTGYLNFIFANEVVVTAKYWREGLPEKIKQKDEEAKMVLQKALPGRKIVQIDCIPLHHDGAGLHCHSRNQPARNNK